MAYKFKRYKIKWNFKKRKFKKIKKDRKKSREAYMRFRRHRAKMLAALRKNRKKIKRKSARNRNAGIQRKLARARKKYKHLLKNSLEYELNTLLFEGQEIEPEVEIDEDDLKEVADTLDDMKSVVGDEDEELEKYIDDAKDVILHVIEAGDRSSDQRDERAVSDILRFVENFYKLQNEEE